MAVIDLDDSYAPRSAPTVLDVSLDDHVSDMEDPRLFQYRGALYLLVAASQASCCLFDDLTLSRSGSGPGSWVGVRVRVGIEG